MDKNNPLPREDVYDASHEVPFRRKVTPLRALGMVVAILMIFMGLLWTAEAVGLVAAVIPGGPGLIRGTIWGAVGLVGVFLLVIILMTMRERRD